jgi:hypothetical protein
MSDLIMIIRRINNSRRFLRTQEDTTPKWRARGRQVGPASPTYRVASLGPHLSASTSLCRFSIALRIASTPFIQVGLIQGLRIDALAYIY